MPAPGIRRLVLPSSFQPSPLFEGDCVIMPNDEFSNTEVGELMEVHQLGPALQGTVLLARAKVVGVVCCDALRLLQGHAINDVRFSTKDRMGSFHEAVVAFPSPRLGQNYTALYLERVD